MVVKVVIGILAYLIIGMIFAGVCMAEDLSNNYDDDSYEYVSMALVWPIVSFLVISAKAIGSVAKAIQKMKSK